MSEEKKKPEPVTLKPNSVKMVHKTKKKEEVKEDGNGEVE